MLIEQQLQVWEDGYSQEELDYMGIPDGVPVIEGLPDLLWRKTGGLVPEGIKSWKIFHGWMGWVTAIVTLPLTLYLLLISFMVMVIAQFPYEIWWCYQAAALRWYPTARFTPVKGADRERRKELCLAKARIKTKRVQAEAAERARSYAIALEEARMHKRIAEAQARQAEEDRLRKEAEVKAVAKALAEEEAAARLVKLKKELRDPTYWKRKVGRGIPFEKAVLRLFAMKGYKGTMTTTTGDGGVDLVLEKDGERTIVQCKAYTGAIGVAHVRELAGIMKEHPDAKEFMLVAIHGFSQGAHRVANLNGIKLYSIMKDHI